MTAVKLPESYGVLSDYFVENPMPILGVETIQIVLLREVLDYSIFRTEESKELNTEITPVSIDSDESIERVVFLGGKQKAVESRQLASLLRTVAKDVGYQIEECYLKDHLCLECPRCALFGGTSTSSYKTTDSNIKHRISYSTAYSLESFESIQDNITFNGIDDKKVNPGQALGTKNYVKPTSVFPSIITLRSVTWKELLWTIKTILSAHKYGAESRTGGDIRNNIVGFAGGWEELITPLELTLELAEVNKLDLDTIIEILKKYKKYASNTNKIKILSTEELNNLLEETQKYNLTKEFITESYQDVISYRKEQEE